MDKAAAPRSSLGTAPSGVPALPTAFAAKHPRLVRGQRCALPTASACHQVLKNSSLGQPGTAEQPPYRPRLGRSPTWGAAPPRPPRAAPLEHLRRSGTRQGQQQQAAKPSKQPPARFKQQTQATPLPSTKNRLAGGLGACGWPGQTGATLSRKPTA